MHERLEAPVNRAYDWEAGDCCFLENDNKIHMEHFHLPNLDSL